MRLPFSLISLTSPLSCCRFLSFLLTLQPAKKECYYSTIPSLFLFSSRSWKTLDPLPVDTSPKKCSSISFRFCFLHSYALLRVTFCVIITSSRSKGSTVFVTSSCKFLDEKTVLEIWLNLGLNLIIFQGTGPRLLLG